MNDFITITIKLYFFFFILNIFYFYITERSVEMKPAGATVLGYFWDSSRSFLGDYCIPVGVHSAYYNAKMFVVDQLVYNKGRTTLRVIVSHLSYLDLAISLVELLSSSQLDGPQNQPLDS